MYGPSGNKLTALLAIANAFQDDSSCMATLEMRRNQLDSQAATHLAHAMIGMKTLTTLDLKENDIETEGVLAIAEAMPHSHTLTALDISGNQIVKCISVDYLDTGDLRPFDPLAWDGGRGGQQAPHP